MMDVPTTAVHVGQLVLAQAIDTPEGPLYVALFWAFVAAFFGFLFAVNTNGFSRTLRKIYLLPALFAFICITWFISGKDSDISAVLTIYGGIGASVIVVILLLMRGPSTPRNPS